MKIGTQAGQDRRDKERGYRAAAKASRTAPVEAPVIAAHSLTVWRTKNLPHPRAGSVGVPLTEGISSVVLGSIAYVPVALYTDYAAWNYVVAVVLVLALSYALCSRRVVIGPEFIAVRKLGPYRLALADSITSGALKESQRGGVLKLSTGDGHVMRLRRVEFSNPTINAALRSFILSTGRKYTSGVMMRLDLPWREDFGHHRYLLDAVS